MFIAMCPQGSLRGGKDQSIVTLEFIKRGKDKNFMPPEFIKSGK